MSDNSNPQNQPPRTGGPSEQGDARESIATVTVSTPAGRRRKILLISIMVLLALGAVAYFWQPWRQSDVVSTEHAHDVYTCPMHPQIKSNTPGRCPICHMDLVLVSKPATATVIYTCPMHPQIKSDTPGTCPICHMDLVPVSTPSGGNPSAGSDTSGGMTGAVMLSDEGRITANVRTVVVGYRSIPSRLVAPAGVDYNEATYKVVTARAAGRVERLFVDQTGQYVRRGAPLLEIYSPDLVSAQQDYLTARSAPTLELPSLIGSTTPEEVRGRSERRQRLINASRRRLELLGMTAAQIDALERRGEISYTTTLFSPVSGIVVKRAIAEGAYANVGTVLLEIVDLSSVWVIANVGENESYGLRPGMEMAITGPAIGGEMISGRVDFIYPTVDAGSRTVKVRGVFANTGMRLKPGMYITATILVPGGDALVVPVSAAVRTGRRDLVYVEVAPNTFEPREVRLGTRDGDYYRVIGGKLDAGEKIVAEGGFLLDSERRLGSAGASDAMNGMSMPENGNTGGGRP